MIGVGVTVGSGVADGVAGTGVNVARLVAVGQAVLVGITVTPATAVAVGDCRMRPHPPAVRLTMSARHTRAAARCSFIHRLRNTGKRNRSLPELVLATAGPIVAKERGKVKRCGSSLTPTITGAIIGRTLFKGGGTWQIHVLKQ